MSQCYITENKGSLGGGIFNGGTLNLVDSTISQNYGAQGPGLYNVGVLTALNSTIAYFFGSDGTGGALYNFGGEVTINNSTLGLVYAPNSAAIYNNYGRVTLGHNILQNIGSSPVLENMGGTIRSTGYNFSTDSGAGFLNQTGDLTNASARLGPLQINGGQIPTMAILAGSDAFDAGDPAFAPPPSYDQRGAGFPRVQFGRIDIGAFEANDSYQGGFTFQVNTTDDENDGICGMTHCSLREALSAANYSAAPQGFTNKIGFAPQVKGTIGLTSLLPPISRELNIIGPGADQLTIERISGGNYRIFTIDSQSSVSGLTISNGLTLQTDFNFQENPGSGGGIYSTTSITIDSCHFVGNQAHLGGGFASYRGSATINNCTFSNNEGVYYGGAFITT